MQFRQIEVDFDIHQMIELERRGFDEPPYRALRRLLKLNDKVDERGETVLKTRNPPPNKTEIHGKPFVEDGVSIPHGSLARMEYLRGSQVYEGQFLDGKLVVNGVSYKSLSAAASDLALTKNGEKTSLNGWLYWQVKFPGETEWKRASALREASRVK
ncbi:MAG TPA: hypothetical protein PKD10_19095 [Paracoccaceae bacterium]|nr:hypothetical protein [Paracoccaceae bacterium]HMO70935.1 hypothetical protein [Paracoccaceae bacterium]